MDTTAQGTSAASAPLSSTAIIAIASAIGVSVICIIALIALLVRAVKIHKQLLADLENRGVSIAQAQGEIQDSVARPRAVLRRNTILPFNSNTGWGPLTSVETFKSGEASAAVAHYVPPKPTEATRRASRLSWPFSSRRDSGHNFPMKKIQNSRLSTVVEDPKLSVSISNQNKPHVDDTSDSTSSPLKEKEYQISSPQMLLQQHPAFRSPNQGRKVINQDRSPVRSSFFRVGANDRLQRAKSVVTAPSAQAMRPPLRARSISLSSSFTGKAPEVLLPPLPLDIDRHKSEAERRKQLGCIPSKLSNSSMGSVDTSILATHSSPPISQANKRRPQKITKPRGRGSTAPGVRPYRDSIDLRAKVLGLRYPTNDNTGQTDAPSSETPYPYNEWKHKYSDRSTSPGKAEGIHSVPSSILSTPANSPVKARSLATPKRRSKTLVSSEGSPERQYERNASMRGPNGPIYSPKRQHSRASSRSSCGNPFQWDPTPLSPTGKPSALKGSPSARQGHRRKNSVRISLVPTYHGPPSRRNDSSIPPEDNEDTTQGAVASRSTIGLGISVPSPRSLPTPPSSSTFSPELRSSTTSPRAASARNSPTKPIISYDRTYVVFPADRVPEALSKHERNQPSSGSVVSLSRFPSTPSIIEPFDIETSEPFCISFNQGRSSSSGIQVPATPLLHQCPFRSETPEPDRPISQSSLIDIDEPDTVRRDPVIVSQANASSRTWQSAFAAIPEESSTNSLRSLLVTRSYQGDSPPVSPKTAAPSMFGLSNQSSCSLPSHVAAIVGETPETIDPAVLTKDAFRFLNSSVSNTDGSNMKTSNSSRSSLSLVIPPTSGSVQSADEPLLEAPLPPGHLMIDINESPVLGHFLSETSSLYSMPSPSPPLSPTRSPIQLPSPVLPCSPRPSHARLPASPLIINFAQMPNLAPSPQGPRESPPRPLRTSIAALRRMNSDAADAEKRSIGRGERRYLRMGREDSLQLSGDESWIEGMEGDDIGELDEAEGRRLVGNVLDDWDEGSSAQSASRGTTDTTETVVDFQQDATAGAEQPMSNIWDDSDNFWISPTSQILESLEKTKHPYQPLTSSPLASPALSFPATMDSTPSRKRDFEVARDYSPDTHSLTENSAGDHDSNKREPHGSGRRNSPSRERYKKRNVLGVGTANVKIQVTSPGGRVMAGPSGSLYDFQGFLRS